MPFLPPFNTFVVVIVLLLLAVVLMICNPWPMPDCVKLFKLIGIEAFVVVVNKVGETPSLVVKLIAI